jgi:hypothetical protein
MPTDITPAHLRCVIGNHCPSVSILPNGNLLIIGTAMDVPDIGDDERAISMSPEYFTTPQVVRFIAEAIIKRKEY